MSVEVPGELPREGLAQAGLSVAVDGGVATVTLDRAQRRNAQTPDLWRVLARVGDSLPGEVRVVVLQGAGPSFSAGLDLRMFQAEGVPGEGSFLDTATLTDAEVETMIAEGQRAFTWLRRPDIVSVAVVRGHAIGAGFQLALACDLRVLADDAQFCMKEPTLGLVPDLTGTKPLVEAVGYPRALEMCLTGRTVGAAEARELGLAELVVGTDELDGAVDDLVVALLATSPGASVATKALLQGAQAATLEEQLAAERRAQVGRLRELFADS